MPVTRRTSLTLSAFAAGLACAACGTGSAHRGGTDSTGLAPSVGSMKPQMDSGIARGERTLDSLHQAGVSTTNALDSTESRVQREMLNQPGRDTSHLNNRATPGAGPAAPPGTPPGSQRP